ncbi:BON domain-containing protein [Ramlibacter sp. MMS24-I3-19]|uniref:BON domain-containing protein n=1 Tax=Ramlibacter sp. MMS24-I3-19 TaxID=3416606 RepID=UPI003D060028
MTPALQRGLLSAAAFGLALALAACGERSDDTTVGQRADSAATRTGQAAKDKLGESSQAASQGSRDASTSVMGAAADARDKAYGSSAETRADGKADDKLTSMVLTGLKADKELNPLRIDVDTREGVVTLSGSVPTAAAKARASEIAQNVKDVKSVNNQLTVSAS